MLRITSLLLTFSALLFLSGCVGFPANTTIKYRTQLSSGLDSAGDPTDNIQAIDTRNGKIYLTTAWFDLAETGYPYRYRAELYDGSGSVVYTATDSFQPGTAGYVTTSWYSFRPVDAPGFWKFKIYLNNHLIGEKPLLVTQSNDGISRQRGIREF